MSLSVKVFYPKEDGQDPEIRRFAVDQDVSTNFEYLSRKVMMAFPDLNDKRFSLQWKDSDGDCVTFSSDEELMEALGCLEGSVFKVYVKAGGARSESENREDASGPVHQGVECDGCSGPVVGTRFKCVVCPDYDLCATCEAKGTHTEHQMIRMRTPKNLGNGPWQFFGHPPPPPPPHGHPPPPPHGHHPPPHGHPPHHPHHGHHGHPPPPPPQWGQMPWDPRAMPPQWRDWMRNCRANVFGWAMPFGGAEDASADMETDESRPGANQDKRSKDTKSDKSEQAKSADRRSPGEDYLKAVGEQVAAMLDPLGIDVAVDVEHGSKLHRCSSKKGKGQGKSSNKSNEEGKEKKSDSADVDMTSEEPAPPEPAPTKPETPKPETMQTEPLDDWTLLGSQLASPRSPSSPSTPSVGTLVEPSAPMSTPAPAPAATAVPPVASQTQSDSQSSATAPPTEQNIYPNLSPSHPDPRIASALRQMLAMGFTDEGGWLTRLLVAKEGNISTVLDAMQPRK